MGRKEEINPGHERGTFSDRGLARKCRKMLTTKHFPGGSHSVCGGLFFLLLFRLLGEGTCREVRWESHYVAQADLEITV